MNTRTFPMIMFLVVVFFLISTSHDAHACSCVEITELQALERSSASFVGTPVKIEFSSNRNNLVTFQIEIPIKDVSEDMTEVLLITPTQDSACGYNFKNHTKYLVHTFEQENQKYLGTSICNGNKNLGFSSIPMLIDKSVLGNHPETISWHPIDLYLILVGIISSIVVGVIIYSKKRKRKVRQ